MRQETCMPKPKSSTLFHFTKTLDNLEGILINGFFPRYSPEDMEWVKDSKMKFIAFPIVCFCDISLLRITEHVEFYGSFGIGMDKDWALLNGLNPVLYVTGTSPVSQSIPKAVESGNVVRKKSNDDSYLNHARCTVAFTKPISGTTLVNNKPVPKDFYPESEWRYLARDGGVIEYLLQESFNDSAQLQSANQIAKEKATLQFTPKDVRYLLVRSDADIPNLVDFINTSMDRHPAADLKVLLTRIVSLDTIHRDI